MIWPWRKPAPAPAATVDVEQVAAAAAERAVSELLARADRQQSPFTDPRTGSSPYPVYAYDHPIWFQVPQSPQRRPGSVITIATIRKLADTYDVLRACINHLRREVASVPIAVVPRDDSQKSDAIKKRVITAQQWLEQPGGLGGPGRRRAHFEGEIFEDVLVVGAAAAFFSRTRGGQLTSVVAIDAATIRPRVDAFGWPGPDEICYEQWIEGIHMRGFTRDELLYDGVYSRSYTPYFASPIEFLVHTINSALRADDWNRAWLTDGNTPSDLIALPESWSPGQIREWAEYWDGLLSGNSAQRQKTKFVPAGSQRLGSLSRKDQEFSLFELWLLRRTCAIMGVQPASIGFVGEQYKVTQDASMDATTEFGVGPLLDFRKSLYDNVLRRLGYDDLEIRNVTAEADDSAERAEKNVKLVAGGIKTVNEARQEEGLDPMPGGDVLLVPVGLRTLEQALAEPPDAPDDAPDDDPVDDPADLQDDPEEEVKRALLLWEKKALNRLRRHSSASCTFAHAALPADLTRTVEASLQACETAEDVRELFRATGESGHWITSNGRKIFIPDKTGQKASGRVSFEAVPGKSTGVIPGIHRASYSQKLEYTHAVLRAMAGESGENALATAAGLTTRHNTVGPGFWQGETNPSVQVDVDLGGQTMDGEVRVRVEAFCAATGLILDQEAVGYQQGDWSGEVDDHNAVFVVMGRTITDDEVRGLYGEIRNLKGPQVADGAVLIADYDGVRVLNFTGLGNDEFRGILKAAVARAGLGISVSTVGSYRVDARLVEASDYERSLGQYRTVAEGPSSLHGTIEGVHAGVAGVRKDFADRYGWADPSGSG